MKYNLKPVQDLWRFSVSLLNHKDFYSDQIKFAYESAIEVEQIFGIDTFDLRTAIKILGIKCENTRGSINIRKLKALYDYYKEVISELDRTFGLVREIIGK